MKQVVLNGLVREEEEGGGDGRRVGEGKREERERAAGLV